MRVRRGFGDTLVEVFPICAKGKYLGNLYYLIDTYFKSPRRLWVGLPALRCVHALDAGIAQYPQYPRPG